MGKETHHDLFGPVIDQYNALEIVNDPLFSPSEHEHSQARTYRKYELKTFLGIVDTNIGFVDHTGHSSAIKSRLYYEYGQVLQKEAEQLKSGPQAETLYQYAALLCMNSAIENSGITEQNAHAVFHCLAQVANIDQENSSA